jgi:hypothetical protein
MSVRRSSAFETSSDSSIPSSPKSRTIPHSVTAGESPRTPRRSWLDSARRLGASLTLKLVGLVGIFIALPIVLYSQFESADRQMRDLVTRAIQDRSKLIGHALAPVLRAADRRQPHAQCRARQVHQRRHGAQADAAAARRAGEAENTASFYFVASAPRSGPTRWRPSSTSCRAAASSSA